MLRLVLGRIALRRKKKEEEKEDDEKKKKKRRAMTELEQGTTGKDCRFCYRSFYIGCLGLSSDRDCQLQRRCQSHNCRCALDHMHNDNHRFDRCDAALDTRHCPGKPRSNRYCSLLIRSTSKQRLERSDSAISAKPAAFNRISCRQLPAGCGQFADSVCDSWWRL